MYSANLALLCGALQLAVGNGPDYRYWAMTTTASFGSFADVFPVTSIEVFLDRDPKSGKPIESGGVVTVNGAINDGQRFVAADCPKGWLCLWGTVAFAVPVEELATRKHWEHRGYSYELLTTTSISLLGQQMLVAIIHGSPEGAGDNSTHRLFYFSLERGLVAILTYGVTGATSLGAAMWVSEADRGFGYLTLMSRDRGASSKP